MCALQLEQANELLSEEEVWYILSEMAQVMSPSDQAPFISAHASAVSTCSICWNANKLHSRYICLLLHACMTVYFPAGLAILTCKWGFAFGCEAG